MASDNGTRSDEARTAPLMIGIDVGSTTVKATVVDPESKEILWSDYQRHNTKQPEMALDYLERIEAAFPNVAREDIRIFTTGSGSGPIAPQIGAKFVQEVNAVTLAVEHLHPTVGSVVELGGQDAKIIIFRVNQETGEKTPITSMNDKCASGTGATIDKCVIKVGLEPAEVIRVPFDHSKLHHVAAKCGVFAETDIVNLVKTGIPADEIMNSLADAIVMQNLSVLTRGNTLPHDVLLLGGPNTYLPFLQACWRKRIPETWEERGYAYPDDRPLEELIYVPENAQYYAAYGAVLFGAYEPAHIGLYKGVDDLREFIANGRKNKLGDSAGPPLVRSMFEAHKFADDYRVPKFEPAYFEPGTHIEAFLGLDGGSTSSKCVLMSRDGEVLKKEYQLSKGNPIQDTKEMLARLRDWATGMACTIDIVGFGATGYAADVLEEALKADVNIVETVAHMKSAVHFFGDVDVICDIGGQDIKVLFLNRGDIKNFRLSNQCSAGNGMLLQAMADQFGLPVTEYADTAFRAELSPKFSYGCAVFLDSDRVNFQKEGYSKEELLAGLALVLPKNVWQYVVQIPRMAELGRKFVLQGGTQHNLAAVKSQVDYILERVPEGEVFIHPHTGEAGAIGAAMEAVRVIDRRGYSTFVGLDSAIGVEYTTRNDDDTRCYFCPNHCSRTFIDTKIPDGTTARYISGFSCEKGTVESEQAMIALTKERKSLIKKYPNLVDYESKLAFRHFFKYEPLPPSTCVIEDIKVTFNWLGMRKRTLYKRNFQRSPTRAAERRRRIRVGLPRVLNMYSTGPFWRTLLEVLGIQKQNVVWSDYTSEEMWREGGKYGSVDPCFPSKSVQAHFHNLLFHKHEKAPLDYIFFPSITQVESPLVNLMDKAACPIVSGAPKVMRAAFTKEVDFFAERGITYLDTAVTMIEPNLLTKQLFQAWGPELEVTFDEIDWAVKQAFAALRAFDGQMQTRGRAILDQVEADDAIAILMLGRPYHNDPGLNHGVLEEFQALGYPVLSIRSLPTDVAYLERFFKEDLESGRIPSPLDVNDVWPENYSSNSVHKVWAAKFAARNPHIAVLDLSSFKCGHDAPVYGMIDSIIGTSGTPYSALHDIDANKPGGSIKIRVKTYAYSLQITKEKLEDRRGLQRELTYRIDQKRLALLRMKQEQRTARGLTIDSEIDGQIEQTETRLEAYVAKYGEPDRSPTTPISESREGTRHPERNTAHERV